MTCWRCGGRTEPRRVRFCVPELSPPVLITNLPADVCCQCGEQTYSTHTLTVLQRARDGEAPEPRLGYVHVFDFEELNRNHAAMDGSVEMAQSLVVLASTTVDVAPIREAVG